MWLLILFVICWLTCACTNFLFYPDLSNRHVQLLPIRKILLLSLIGLIWVVCEEFVFRQMLVVYISVYYSIDIAKIISCAK